MIAAFASSAAQLAEAERALAQEGYVEVDEDHEGRRRRNPWLLVKASALDGINRFGSLLGMSPSARAHLAVPMSKVEPGPDDPARLLTQPKDGPGRLLS